MPRVTYVTLATGFNVILNEFMAAKRFDLKHGVNIDVINSYVSVTNYYNDFTAGTFELGIGAWDTWAARFLAGVPLKLVSTITDYDMLFIVAMQGGPKSVADLRGKTLAAIQSSGAFRVTKHCARKLPQHAGRQGLSGPEHRKPCRRGRHGARRQHRSRADLGAERQRRA